MCRAMSTRKRHLLALGTELAAYAPFDPFRMAENTAAFGVVFGEHQIALADHLPGDLATQKAPATGPNSRCPGPCCQPSGPRRPVTRPPSTADRPPDAPADSPAKISWRLSANRSASVRSMARTVRWK